MHRPEVIAHRGFTAQHRENTLAAFVAAAGLGVDGIELDVHATADGVVVVHHDAEVRPNEGRDTLRISDVPADQLRSAAAAVPTLSEVLNAVGQHATVYVEIKAPRIESLVCETVQAGAARCAVHAFDHRVIAKCRELAPDLPRGILMASYPVDPIAPMRDTGARDLWQHWDLIDADLVSRVHDAGGRVLAWTVNAVADARRLASLGVDGICTDQSAAVIEALGLAPDRPPAPQR